MRMSTSFGLNDSPTTQTIGASQASASAITGARMTRSPKVLRMPWPTAHAPWAERPIRIWTAAATSMSTNSTCEAAAA